MQVEYLVIHFWAPVEFRNLANVRSLTRKMDSDLQLSLARLRRNQVTTSNP